MCDFSHLRRPDSQRSRYILVAGNDPHRRLRC
jgi:hypothetical protein